MYWVQDEILEKYLNTSKRYLTFTYPFTLGSGTRNIGNDSNSIIYGHNMKNDSMFGTLPDYSSQEYYEANPHWYLLTPTADYKIELIAEYVTHSTFPMT